jgi:anthranilate synthase/aminodeoxychorismate synthase-like glutamine amidotransferase
MILVIDNYDSFVHNLARYFRQLGQTTSVYRNDEISVEQIRQLSPDAIVISPGPCAPDKAGVSLEVVAELTGQFPILGVCLGHQAIVQALGGDVVCSGGPMHGRSSSVKHTQTKLFTDIKSPFQVGRYHSLIADKFALPDCLNATATDASGTIMAVEHRSEIVVGVQFHPESILTESGYQLLANFLRMCGVDVAQGAPL